jgi:hypothetical protein
VVDRRSGDDVGWESGRAVVDWRSGRGQWTGVQLQLEIWSLDRSAGMLVGGAARTKPASVD